MADWLIDWLADWLIAHDNMLHYTLPTCRTTTLHYIYSVNIEGAAESVRLALALTGIPYEDDRIAFPEWKDLKPKTPYGQLPVLSIDDGPMKTQSLAMLRYVASLDTTGTLYPIDKFYDMEEAIGLVQDIQNNWSPNLYISMNPSKFGYPTDYPTTPEGQAKIESMRKEWIATELPRFLTYLEGMLDKHGGTSFLCGGDSPTIADCFAVPMLRNFTKGHIDHVNPNCVAESSAKVAAYVERFCALSAIQGRYASGLGSSSS